MKFAFEKCNKTLRNHKESYTIFEEQDTSVLQQVQETTEDGMAGLQSKFQNLRTDRQTDIINP